MSVTKQIQPMSGSDLHNLVKRHCAGSQKRVGVPRGALPSLGEQPEVTTPRPDGVEIDEGGAR